MKASENQPNGFLKSCRKLQPSPFQKIKAFTTASSLVLELLEHGSKNICELEGCVAEGLFSTDVIKSYFIILELPLVTTEIFEAFRTL